MLLVADQREYRNRSRFSQILNLKKNFTDRKGKQEKEKKTGRFTNGKSNTVFNHF
jgi:hypothetical protein